MKILLMTSLWGRHGGKEHFLECCIDHLFRQGHHCVLAYSRRSSKAPMIALPAMREYQLPAYEVHRSPEDDAAASQLQVLLHDEEPDAIFMCDLRNDRMLDVLHGYGGTVTMAHDNWLTCMRGLATSYFRREICNKKLGVGCLLKGCFVRKSPVDGSLIYNNFFDHMAILKSYRRFSFHVVASNYMRDRLLLNGFTADQVDVVGYFTDLEPKERHTLTDETPTILFTGRIDRYKGVDFLLQALAQITSAFRCRIVGDGPQLPFCKKLCTSLGLDDKVEFLGWQTREAVQGEFLKATVLAVTPLWPEAFGLIGLEAGTCGIPVVAFETGGIADWLEDGVNGFLVPVKRADLLAEKLGVLLQNPEKARAMGMAGRTLVQTRFSRSRFFDKLMPTLHRAAAQRKQPGRPIDTTTWVPLHAVSSGQPANSIEVSL